MEIPNRKNSPWYDMYQMRNAGWKGFEVVFRDSYKEFTAKLNSPYPPPELYTFQTRG
jgi:hypothetical protein